LYFRYARTRVHRGREHEARGEGEGAFGSRDAHHPLFERLAEALEDIPVEFRQLIKKQDPMMRQGDLAGFWDGPASDQRDGGARVVRGAERAAPEHRAAVQQPGDAVDGHRLQRFLD